MVHSIATVGFLFHGCQQSTLMKLINQLSHEMLTLILADVGDSHC